jgi:predicted dinucleotide-binding enzyme
MKIGIIGAGQIGGTLTRRLAALGHEVFVANSRGPETLSALAEETGATAVSVTDAARRGELVVVTIPEVKVRDLPRDLFGGTADGVVVVDTGNYYPRQRDGRIDEIEAGLPESGWVARRLGRPVVKAFNNIYAQHLMELGRPAGTPGRIALPVAGDDDLAKGTVLTLVDELGFDGVDAGPLEESWRQQPGTPVYCTDLDAAGVRRALAEAKAERAAQWRGTTRRGNQTPAGDLSGSLPEGRVCSCSAVIAVRLPLRADVQRRLASPARPGVPPLEPFHRSFRGQSQPCWRRRARPRSQATAGGRLFQMKYGEPLQ